MVMEWLEDPPGFHTLRDRSRTICPNCAKLAEGRQGGYTLNVWVRNPVSGPDGDWVRVHNPYITLKDSMAYAEQQYLLEN